MRCNMRWFVPTLLLLAACSDRGVVRTFRARQDAPIVATGDTDTAPDTDVVETDTDAVQADDTDVAPVWPDVVDGYAATVACLEPTSAGGGYRWRVTAIVPEVPRGHAPHGIDEISVDDVWFVTPEGCWAPSARLAFDGNLANVGASFTFTAYSTTLSCDLAGSVGADLAWTVLPVGEADAHVYAETADLDPAGLCRG